MFFSGCAMGSCRKLWEGGGAVCWEDLTASFSVRMNEIGAEPVLSMWCKATEVQITGKNVIINIKKALFLPVVTWIQAYFKMFKVHYCCINNQQHKNCPLI